LVFTLTLDKTFSRSETYKAAKGSIYLELHDAYLSSKLFSFNSILSPLLFYFQHPLRQQWGLLHSRSCRRKFSGECSNAHCPVDCFYNCYSHGDDKYHGFDVSCCKRDFYTDRLGGITLDFDDIASRLVIVINRHLRLSGVSLKEIAAGGVCQLFPDLFSKREFATEIVRLFSNHQPCPDCDTSGDAVDSSTLPLANVPSDLVERADALLDSSEVCVLDAAQSRPNTPLESGLDAVETDVSSVDLEDPTILSSKPIFDIPKLPGFDDVTTHSLSEELSVQHRSLPYFDAPIRIKTRAGCLTKCSPAIRGHEKPLEGPVVSAGIRLFADLAWILWRHGVYLTPSVSLCI